MARFGRFALLVALACGVGDAQCNGIKAGGAKMWAFVFLELVPFFRLPKDTYFFFNVVFLRGSKSRF